MKRLPIVSGICLIFVAAFVVLTMQPTALADRNLKVASAKGGVIGNQMLSIRATDQILMNLALNDEGLGDLLNGRDVDLISALPVGVSASAEYPSCTDACTHLRLYNYTDGGTIEAIYNGENAEFVASWNDRTARPNPSAYLVEKVVDIAANDAHVREVLGDLRRAKVAMIPMSTWLADDDCRDDWCVDLTFHDPAGSGKIFHIVSNMHSKEVARTFFTRGRDSRVLQQGSNLDELDPNSASYTDGCREQYGWNVCWEMTPDDGLNFYDASFDGELVFDSTKITQVEAYYPSWPGGYRDEIGFASTVPPKFDTRIFDLGNAFEVRQLFTEPFDWPNCICCYRYEQIIVFSEDGSFETLFVSHGPGCDDLSEYRPFWRINMALRDVERDQAWYWDEDKWTQAQTEVDLDLYGSSFINGERLATVDDGVAYEWIPAATDPLGLDEGRLFLVNSEGNVDTPTGPADTYDPPRGYTNGESLVAEESDLAVWYVPVLKTIRGGPWWCQPDPEPEFSPCYSSMRAVRRAKLSEPTEEQLATLRVVPTETPVPAVTEASEVADSAETAQPIAAVSTLRPTPRAITGNSAEEIILNSGCGACHEIGALGGEGKVGPDLSNIAEIAGSRVPGQSAETYLYNSIIYPNIYIAPDCPNSDCLANIMPNNYHLTLSEAQVNTMVSYLMTQGDVGARPLPAADGSIPGSQPEALAPAPINNVELNGSFPNNLLLLGIGFTFLAVAFALVAIFLLMRRMGKSAEK